METPIMENEDTTKPTRLSAEGSNLAVMSYNHIEQQASLSANKSALLMAAHALIGATYVTIAKDFHLFAKFQGSFKGWLFGIAGALLLAGLTFALAAIFPKSKPDKSGDVFFFASIAAFTSREAFVKKFFDMDIEGFDQSILENIYGKSKWLAKNFLLIRASILCSGAGLSLAIISIWLMRDVIG
jgi:hypothetical protein